MWDTRLSLPVLAYFSANQHSTCIRCQPWEATHCWFFTWLHINNPSLCTVINLCKETQTLYHKSLTRQFAAPPCGAICNYTKVHPSTSSTSVDLSLKQYIAWNRSTFKLSLNTKIDNKVFPSKKHFTFYFVIVDLDTSNHNFHFVVIMFIPGSG